jgi:predicted nucleic acid-binding protein
MHLAAMTRTVFLELIQGSRTTSQVKMVEDLWSLCIPLPITDDMWTSCAHICRDARARGDIFNPLDVLVAVCARDHEARLLHRDEDHERIAKFLT